MKNQFIAKILVSTIFITYSFDLNGQQTFEKAFDRGKTFSCLLTTDNGYYVAGADDTSRLTIYKLNNIGDTIWVQYYGVSNLPGNTWPGKMILASDGNIVLVGSWWPGLAARNMYILKIDTSGIIIWETVFYLPNANDLSGHGIEATQDGYFIATGNYSIAGDENIIVVKIDSSGNIVWHRSFDYGADNAMDVVIKSNTEYLIAGFTDFSTSLDSVYGIIISVDSSGNFLWDKFYGSTKRNTIFALKQLSDSNIILAGYTLDSISQYEDPWILKIDLNGSIIWEKSLPKPEREMIFSVDEKNTTIYLAGKFETINNPIITNGYIIAIDEFGNEIWSNKYLNCNNLFDIMVDSNNYLLACGRTDSYNLGYDLYVTKLFSDGTLTNITQNNITVNSIVLYPNPCSSIIYISTSNNEKIIRVTISDVGLNLQNTLLVYSNIAENIVSIPLKNFSNGVYLASIEFIQSNNIRKITYNKFIINN